MSSREARRERRAAERKSQKLARKAELSSPAAALPPPGQFVSQNEPGIADARNRQRDQAAFRSESTTKRGPRTPEGKRTSSRNSLKHGLTAATLVVSREERSEFHALLQSLLEEHQPANRTEQLLVEQMAQSHWLSQRAIRLQEQCFGEHGVDEKGLALFLRYFTTHERAFHKALNTLLRLKKERTRGKRLDEPAFEEIQAPRSAFHFSEAETQTRFVSQNADAPPDEAQFVSQNDRDLVPKSFADLVDAADFDQFAWPTLETLPEAA